MYVVEISDRQSLIPVSEQELRQIVEDVLRCEGVQQAEIVVALVDDETIHTVNREHLEHDYPTDVISFLYESTEVGTTASERRGAGMQLDGELVISTETAIREAADYGWSPIDELRLYVTHGLLHLCGYDDLSDEEQAFMRDRERAILKNWNLVPHYD